MSIKKSLAAGLIAATIALPAGNAAAHGEDLWNSDWESSPEFRELHQPVRDFLLNQYGDSHASTWLMLFLGPSEGHGEHGFVYPNRAAFLAVREQFGCDHLVSDRNYLAMEGAIFHNRGMLVKAMLEDDCETVDPNFNFGVSPHYYDQSLTQYAANNTNGNSWKALFELVMAGGIHDDETETFAYLTSHKDSEVYTPLLREYLRQMSVDGEFGMLPFIKAAVGIGDAAFVRALIDDGVSCVGVAAPEGHESLAAFASNSGHADIAQMLHDYDAVNCGDNCGDGYVYEASIQSCRVECQPGYQYRDDSCRLPDNQPDCEAGQFAWWVDEERCINPKTYCSSE